MRHWSLADSGSGLSMAYPWLIHGLHRVAHSHVHEVQGVAHYQDHVGDKGTHKVHGVGHYQGVGAGSVT